jgi:sugar/nucleoside kinase (ribokinase family)
MYDVIVVGDYCFDLILTGLPQLPGLGSELFGKGCSILPGGAYNTVVAMKRLGMQVGWASDFGNDEFSQYVLAQVKGEGLDEKLFGIHKYPIRHITIAASFPQDRSFISYSDPQPLLQAGIIALITQSTRCLFIPGLYYGSWFSLGVRLARFKGIAIAMDGNSSSETLNNTPSLAQTISKLDVFLPNSSEAGRITDSKSVEDALLILDKLCPCVVIKDGRNGAYASDGKQIYHSPAIAVDSVETTGAGDCFDAGFMKAWLEGLPLEACLQWGNIVGGLSTLAEGGTSIKISQQEVEKWLLSTRP